MSSTRVLLVLILGILRDRPELATENLAGYANNSRSWSGQGRRHLEIVTLKRAA